MSDNEPESSAALENSLMLAFPLWYEELKQKPMSYIESRRSICSQVIAEKGDIIMYGSKKKGAAGEAFNKFAEGVAVLVLITGHKVPFGRLVFYPDGTVKKFINDEQAYNEVFGQ